MIKLYKKREQGNNDHRIQAVNFVEGRHGIGWLGESVKSDVGY